MNFRTQHAGRLAGLLIAGSFGLLSCGDSVPDSVFLYIINGYPASDGMTIIGPAGPVVRDAKFGDRMAANGVCPPGEACVPIEVDRRFGSEDWTVMLDGMPQTAELTKDLFAMYPQETGTLVVTRRSEDEEVQGTLLRHTQSINAGCSLVMYNGLSLSNNYMSSSSYTIAPEFRVEPVESAGYSNELNTAFLTECGALPTTAPEHEALARSELYAAVQAQPWFFPVTCEEDESENAVCYGWGIPHGAEQISRLQEGGLVSTARVSRNYYDCVQDAITIKQPEMDGAPLPFPPADAQVQCPEGELTWGDVQIDAEAIAECQRPIIKTSSILEPAAEDATLSFLAYDERLCQTEFRLRNIGQDIIFGPKGDDAEGSNQNGEIITSEISAAPGSQHFWVLLGRPVNPIIWQWDSTNSFVDLRASENGFPYPNSKNEMIGVYDSNAE